MKKKYNIALLPKTTASSFIKLSQSIADIKETYCLGEKSLPHITLCQFYCLENEIEAIWQNVCNSITPTQLEVKFTELKYNSLNNKLYWVWLAPNQSNLLNEMHKLVVKFVNSITKKPYEPHLTLINTLDPEAESKIKPAVNSYKTISDEFYLALGDCDKIGQFKKIIKTNKIT